MNTHEVDDNEGRETAATGEISRRLMNGPVGALFLVFIGMVLSSMLADAGITGLIAWAVVCCLAGLAAALIVSCAS